MADSERKKGWERVKFGDVVRQAKDKVDPAECGLDRYIAGEHMDTDDPRLRRWGTIGDGYLGPAFHMRFKPGQVLYGSRRTYLRKVAVADFVGICANTTYVLESADPKVLMPELLPFIMQTDSFNEHSVKQSRGSVNPYINFSDLGWYEFALPPLDEQRKIAQLLSAAVVAIHAGQEAMDALRLVRTNLIRQFDSAACLAGLTSFSSVIGAIEAGISPSSEGRAANEHECGVLKVSAVGDWIFEQTENKAIRADLFQQEIMVRDGDFLMTRANAELDGVGRTCVVGKTRRGLILSDKTWRLTSKPDNGLEIMGILAWTKSPTFRAHILGSLNGTGARNISQRSIMAAPFPLIEKDEFNDFSDRISAVVHGLHDLQRQQEERCRLNSLLRLALLSGG